MATRVCIRPVALSDSKPFLAAVRASRVLHHPWIAAPDTPAKFRAYIRRMVPPANYGFLICHRDTGALIGIINLTSFRLPSDSPFSAVAASAKATREFPSENRAMVRRLGHDISG